MTNEQQALAEMPIWLVIVLAVIGGVSGEMWRADKEGFADWPDGWRIWDAELDEAAFEDGFPGWEDGPAPRPPARPRLH